MSYEIPPLNSLRAFEACGRHLSFTKAAKELFVSQAAISHQIKILEEHLGLKLFKRYNKSISLTVDGGLYHNILKESFSNISKGTKGILFRKKTECLNISVLGSFASTWLLPLLPVFQKKYPQFEVRISVSDEIIDFHSTDFDLAIRYGSGKWKDTSSILVLRENYILCCHPSIYPKEKIMSAKELSKYTLIYDDQCIINWQTFFRNVLNFSSFVPHKTLRFDDSKLVVQAAIEKMGIALTRDAIARESIKKGDLKPLFDRKIDGVFAYHIVYPNFVPMEEKVKIFIDWIRDMAKQQSLEDRQ